MLSLFLNLAFIVSSTRSTTPILIGCEIPILGGTKISDSCYAVLAPNNNQYNAKKYPVVTTISSLSSGKLPTKA
jgi:hypothetical protein